MEKSPAVRNLTLDDLSGGIDLRQGIATDQTNIFRELRNYWTAPGRSLVRRPPFALISGALDPRCQGSKVFAGVLHVVAPAGLTMNHTLSEPVTTLAFDVPEGATGAWTLVDFNRFNGKPVAVIAHTFASTAAPVRTFLHVWDDKRPTYVTDPACPTTWGDQYPLHPFGGGKLGAYRMYNPRLTTTGDRLWLSRPDKNLSGSAAQNARTWNDRSPEDILTNGRWFYYVSSNPVDGQDWVFTVPLPHSDMVADARYAAYILEMCGPEGSWVALHQVTAAPDFGEYVLSAQINRFDPAAPAESKISLRFPVDGVVVRFRAFAKPPVQVQSGQYVLPDGTVVTGVLTHEGNGYVIDARSEAAGIVNNQNYYILAQTPGSLTPLPGKVPAAPNTMPLLGEQRYYARVIASVIGSTGPTAFLYAVAGTATVTVGSSRVAGVGTSFHTQLEVGRFTEINGERRIVKTILGATVMEVETPFTATAAGVTVLRDIRYRYAYEIGDTGNAWYAAREAEATFELSGKDDAVMLATSVHSPSGSEILSCMDAQGRLIIQYADTIQLWAVGANALTDIRMLSVQGQTSGGITAPEPVLLDGEVALPTSQGVRLFSPFGQGRDYIQFAPVGDRVAPMGSLNFTRAVWWHHIRTLLTCTSDGNTLFALTMHRDPNTHSWATWDISGITRIDGLTLHGNDLLLRSGNQMYRASTTNPVFKDAHDVTPYVSRVRWLYLRFKAPDRNKRLLRFGVNQKGKSRFEVFTNPRAEFDSAVGPSTSGTTLGLAKVPLAILAPAAGLALESTDETGHELQNINVDYILLNR